MNKTSVAWTIPDTNQFKIWISLIDSFIKSINVSDNQKIKQYDLFIITTKSMIPTINSKIDFLKFSNLIEIKIIDIEDVFDESYISSLMKETFLLHGQYWWILSLDYFKEYQRSLFLDSDIFWNSRLDDVFNNVFSLTERDDVSFNGRPVPVIYSNSAIKFYKKCTTIKKEVYSKLTTINGGIIFARPNHIFKSIKKKNLLINSFYYLNLPIKAKIKDWYNDELLLINLFGEKEINKDLETKHNITSTYRKQLVEILFNNESDYNFHFVFGSVHKKIFTIVEMIEMTDERFNTEIKSFEKLFKKLNKKWASNPNEKLLISDSWKVIKSIFITSRKNFKENWGLDSQPFNRF